MVTTSGRAALDDLAAKTVNFEPEELAGPGWHRDEEHTPLPDERPGEPEPGGSWAIGRQLIDTYEAPVPSIIQGLYAPDSPLDGRNILLEGRFGPLRFHMGVRITDVIDEVRDDGTRVWGWAYETLQGHLERGRMSYEVHKHMDTGRVEFVICAASQRSPTLGPVFTAGWWLFGRRTQLRFYRECGERVARIVSDVRNGRMAVPEPRVVNGLVIAPSDARPIGDDRALRSTHPSDPS